MFIQQIFILLRLFCLRKRKSVRLAIFTLNPCHSWLMKDARGLLVKGQGRLINSSLIEGAIPSSFKMAADCLFLHNSLPLSPTVLHNYQPVFSLYFAPTQWTLEQNWSCEEQEDCNPARCWFCWSVYVCACMLACMHVYTHTQNGSSLSMGSTSADLNPLLLKTSKDLPDTTRNQLLFFPMAPRRCSEVCSPLTSEYLPEQLPCILPYDAWI